ncbi:MAG: type II asparaginase [Azoarcus sp.]|jgi:L-asparaginase|nr:type II asparaginase [Azoarcus sp.]
MMAGLKKLLGFLSLGRFSQQKNTERIEPVGKLPARPGIHVLATGGTIAGRRVSTGPRYRAGVLNIEALLDTVPGLRGLGEIHGEQVVNISSQDMDDATWLKLAHRTQTLLATPEVNAVVITHGTDTLEETACFLDLTLTGNKPVVIVGAMRPAGTLGADGAANLFDAVAVAAHPASAARGVLAVMHSSIFEARDVTKISASSIQAFASPNMGPAGYVNEGQVHYTRPAARPPDRPCFNLSRLENLPPVGIVYGHAGATAVPVRALAEAGFKGIVAAGVGNGNLPRDMLTALAEASGRGIAVVRASRTASGLTLRDIEIDDNRYGFIAAGTLNPQKARVLLQLALTQTQEPSDIQKIFERY